MKVEVDIWKIIDGEITELKHNNTIFTIKESTDTTFNFSDGTKIEKKIKTPKDTVTKDIPPKKIYTHGVKKSYLEKWIQKGVFEVFTLEQFFKAYPLQKKNRKLDRNILKLLEDKKIAQLGKNKYMVAR